eukprot:s2266_g6.t1
MLCHSSDRCTEPEPTPLKHYTGKSVYCPPKGLRLELWIESDTLSSTAASEETGAAKAGLVAKAKYTHRHPLSLIVPPKIDPLLRRAPWSSYHLAGDIFVGLQGGVVTASVGQPPDPGDFIASLPWSPDASEKQPCKWQHPRYADITKALHQLMDAVRDVTSGATELLRPVTVQPWDAELHTPKTEAPGFRLQ